MGPQWGNATTSRCWIVATRRLPKLAPEARSFRWRVVRPIRLISQFSVLDKIRFFIDDLIHSNASSPHRLCAKPVVWPRSRSVQRRPPPVRLTPFPHTRPVRLRPLSLRTTLFSPRRTPLTILFFVSDRHPIPSDLSTPFGVLLAFERVHCDSPLFFNKRFFNQSYKASKPPINFLFSYFDSFVSSLFLEEPPKDETF